MAVLTVGVNRHYSNMLDIVMKSRMALKRVRIESMRLSPTR